MIRADQRISNIENSLREELKEQKTAMTELNKLVEDNSRAGSVASIASGPAGCIGSTNFSLPAKGQRRKFVFGNCLEDTPRAHIEARLKETLECTPIKEIQVRGQYATFGFVEFKCPADMWSFLQSYRK